jgi:hypothetical protein
MSWTQDIQTHAVTPQQQAKVKKGECDIARTGCVEAFKKTITKWSMEITPVRITKPPTTKMRHIVRGDGNVPIPQCNNGR